MRGALRSALRRALLQAGARSMGARSVEGARAGILSHVPARLRDDQTALAYGVGGLGAIGSLSVPAMATGAHYSQAWQHQLSREQMAVERAREDQERLLRQFRASRLPPFGSSTPGAAAQPASWENRPEQLRYWEDYEE